MDTSTVNDPGAILSWNASWRYRFNGAMTSQPWIQEHAPASMEPSQHGYGRRMRPFNGAMTSQPWIPVPPLNGARITPSSFNGAMTSQPWIRLSERQLDTSIPTLADNHPLQWSHDLSAMDTTLKRGRRPSLQWSHDLSAMDTRSRDARQCRPSASMEP